MTATVVGFRWLDVLEKEFDTSFVDLDGTLESESDVEDEDEEWITNARKKMSTLASCFAQLAHKAQTIFQLNAKLEAEMVNLRQNFAESEALNDVLRTENADLIGQLHSLQIQLRRKTSNYGSNEEDMSSIQSKIDEDLKQRRNSCLTSEIPQKEIVLLRRENENLRNELLSVQGELTGARIASKYLDKELTGRIQQLQLVRNGKSGSHIERVWKQLESEIQLHRYKTCVRACRKNLIYGQPKNVSCVNGTTDRPSAHEQQRKIILKRINNEDIGLSVTGGSEHNVPIIISGIQEQSPASACKQLYVGDAILSVNGNSLCGLSHSQAVHLLASQKGNVTLDVDFILSEDEEDVSLTDETPCRFKIFDDDVQSITSSVASNQNGRLSRASVDSIRGSTENILSSGVQSADDETLGVNEKHILNKGILNYIEDHEASNNSTTIHLYNNIAERLPESIFEEDLPKQPLNQEIEVDTENQESSDSKKQMLPEELQDTHTSSTQNLLGELPVSNSKLRSDSTESKLTEDEETILFNGNY